MRVRYSSEGRDQSANSTWFRGDHCSFHPSRPTLGAVGSVERWILPGWLPAEPFIDPDTRVTTFGSCFAAHIGNYLNRRQYNVLSNGDKNAYVVKMGEGIVNSFAIRGQFEWAFRGVTPTTELWHGWDAEKFGYDESVREITRSMFDETDVFVLTLGLSEIWYDEPTGEVFWRAVPSKRFDPARHKFRVSSVAENVNNLHAIRELIREYRPDAHIVLTLSPIPLIATFRDVSCITANTASKAILRSAIDEFFRDASDPRLHYWPAYEIVQEAFGAGRWDEDGHHLKRELLEYVMGLFERYYCMGMEAEQSLVALQVHAMEASGDLPHDGLEAARADDPAALSAWVDGALAAGHRETAELLLEYAEDRSRDPELHELRRSTAAAIANDQANRRAAMRATPAGPTRKPGEQRSAAKFAGRIRARLGLRS
jgi:hypothetical protein